MNIGFNLIDCGLGNNGGSRTIIKCCETLNKIGHKSVIISPVDKFNWFKHEKPLKDIPKDLDWIVATGQSTVKSTFKSSIKNKAWYIRGHEIWSIPEYKLIELYRMDIKKIVNSISLQKKLKQHNIDSKVVWQGIDLELWTNEDRNFNNKITIGCLRNVKMQSKRWDLFIKLSKILGDKYNYVSFGDDDANEAFLTNYIRKPSFKELNKLYNSCHIWFSPVENEGLHNVGLEAGLCGCLILCSNIERNGMILDYAFNDKTAMVFNNIDHAVELIKNPKWNLTTNMINYIRNEIGSREKNMGKFAEVLK